ncbi:hypothetical protein [Weissella cibaria]|uniref:Uncharacterized protein n=1 Tax=Weissella cibaria TaxID=137591 RepID=A0A9Q8JH13_9LACO|nr:hypothetical protein [Weissella cibaria]TVV27197.1 hypothetical protein FO435_04550 [Weissella cibaria]TVV40395.1 hypothetical protein FO438_04390 [Weissella cibaria]
MTDKVQSKLYFQGQQIIALEGKTSKEYELLMRRDIDGVARFPYQEFITTMTDHDQHKQYVTELAVILPKVLSHNPNYTFSFNLDYQELFYEETLALMSRLWTGFFGTERYRTPKIFQNPDFSLKRRDFWVFL